MAKPNPSSTTPDKRALIAEALLDGADDAALLDRLTAAGISEASARYEVERAGRDPLVAAARTLSARLAKRDWTLGLYARLAPVDSIPLEDKIEPDRFYRDFYAANRPVKLTGLVDHWPALTRWSLDRFAEVAGCALVEAQVGREAAADYELAKDRHRRQVRFSDLLDRLRSGDASNDFYLTAYNSSANGEALAPLWDDLGPIDLLEPRPGRDGFFWLGPRGTLTPYHHDLTNNLLVQVLGRKRVKLVPSWETPRMRNHLHCFSAWDGAALEPGARDDERPLVLETVIGPGEAIFLPVGWWHHVEALDLSASMSFTSFRGGNDFTAGYRSYGPL